MIKRFWLAGFLVVMLALLFAQLFLSVRQESQTWDESDHIYAGYMSLTRADYGINPEHPPLVKYVAALPLLNMHLKLPAPAPQSGGFKTAAYMGGKHFLYDNDADAILLRTRLAASVFTFLAALVIFTAAYEVFGRLAACIALTLFVFDPNVLAHGMLVTTDMAISCFLLATLYAFYRYLKSPTRGRLLVVGVAAGLALSSKHSAVLVFPMLLLVAAADWFAARRAGEKTLPISKYALALIVIVVIAVGLLWAIYGFRYASRPPGLQLDPTPAEYFARLKPLDRLAIGGIAKLHLLPESFLYGLADVRMIADWMPTYIFGKVHAHGVWYYFPTAFIIKSTLTLLILVGITIFAIVSGKFQNKRELLVLGIPPIVYMCVALTSGLNIGARHILPIWVFLIVLVAGAASALMHKHAAWKFIVAALLLFEVISSARCYPTYLAYSNELWGGPSKTHLYLSDSNVDWGQQLKFVKRYLDEHNIKHCWFAYFVGGAAEPGYYGIPCKLLPNPDMIWFNVETDVPPEVDGPVLISVGALSGFEFGSSRLNPYEDFMRRKPDAVIQYGVNVYEGRFSMRHAAALSLAQKSRNLMEAKHVEEGLARAQEAVAIDPGVIDAQTALGDALAAVNRKNEARTAYERAITEAEKLVAAKQPEYIPGLREKIGKL